MIQKIKTWLLTFIPTIIGIIEAILKFVKEILTLVMDILFPIISIEKFKTFVTWFRAKVDLVYDWFSKIKEQILKYLGLIG